MSQIINSKNSPEYLSQLHSWFLAEWGKIDSFESNIKGLAVPPPLLVLKEGELLGGLSFTAASKPGEDEIGIWINAVLIKPEDRGKGLATALLQQALLDAAQMNIKEIFAFTDIPLLYQKLGWEIVSVIKKEAENAESIENTVLKIVAVKESS